MVVAEGKSFFKTSSGWSSLQPSLKQSLVFARMGREREEHSWQRKKHKHQLTKPHGTFGGPANLCYV